jgi:hypothetical protein
VQEILHHVREEMEDLQKSRDFWEDHALHADEKVATLQVLVYLLQILLLKIVYLKIFLYAYLLIVFSQNNSSLWVFIV